jgi:signal transduction histidine kinase
MTASVGKAKIMIVDDVPGNIKTLSEILKDQYQIVMVTSGKLALKAVLSQTIELILLDIEMPDMDGYEVCKQLSIIPEAKDIPVIFVTSQNEAKDEARGLDFGAVDYITKPVVPSILKSRLKTQLSLKKLRDSLEEQVTIRTEELQRAMFEAQASERAKSEFIARVSHELRTPLNSIITPTSILMDRAVDTKDKEQLDLINKSAYSLLDLIKGILDFSEVENESTDTKEQFFLDIFLQDIKENWSSRVKKKGLVFVLKTQQLTSPTPCIGNIKNLKQAIDPLLDNAVKFSNSGEIVLSVTPIGMVKDSINYRFEISDSGIGIDPKHIKMLFDAFTQLESTGTRIHGGTGLGLAMAKRIVNRLGGKLEVQSELKKGSSFYFTIPITTDHQNKSDTQSPFDSAQIDTQLTELSLLVDNGFVDVDTFIAKLIHQWNSTPWSQDLQEIVSLINGFNADASLEAITALRKKLSD